MDWQHAFAVLKKSPALPVILCPRSDSLPACSNVSISNSDTLTWTCTLAMLFGFGNLGFDYACVSESTESRHTLKLWQKDITVVIINLTWRNLIPSMNL